ncbi:unnamed protein product [Mycena citricolor]|uniref:Uncharacterized protein n=1 Tax=Mycena citricolor TaxID=2018698 RepID=A0AAD2K752_9AGAR|nr:unnamed protein product [Mycena citricolor]
MSYRKDRIGVLARHVVPAHLSQDEFSQNVHAVVNACSELPEFQNNILELDIVFPNDRNAASVQQSGLPALQNVVLLLFQCRSRENFIQLLSDSRVRATFAKAETDFQFLSTLTLCAADIFDRIPLANQPVEDTPRAGGLALFRFDSDAAAQVYVNRVTEFGQFFRLPSVVRLVRGYATWVGNEAMAQDLRELGFKTLDHAVVSIVESESFDVFTEITREVSSTTMVSSALEDVKLADGSFSSSVTIVSKKKREEH